MVFFGLALWHYLNLWNQKMCFIFLSFWFWVNFEFLVHPLGTLWFSLRCTKCADKSQISTVLYCINADITVMNSIHTNIIIIDKSLIHWMEYIDRISDDSTCLVTCIVMLNFWLLSLKEWMRAPYQVTI